MKSKFLLLSPRFISAVAASALLSATVFAQAPATPAPKAAAPAATPPATPAEKPKPLQNVDDTYVKAATKSMNYLIQLSNAAKTGLSDANLVRFRDTTAKDMATTLAQLTKIAEAHGTKLAIDVVGTDKVDLERLAKVKPDKFPKDWVEAVFKEAKRLDHETEVIAKTAQDPELKTFLPNYTPMIHNVFSTAEAAQKTLKAAKK